MLARLLQAPGDSFFLFGPRGTGKSTLLRAWFPEALWMDLLDHREYVRLLQSPAAFAQTIEAQPISRWIVVDEVQKIPHLLDDVHRLIANKGYRFALSGSSARKLKKGRANLLAGRAFVYHLFPLTWSEAAQQVGLEAWLEFGALPQVVLEKKTEDKMERLQAYVDTYLTEEIKAEALTRQIESFGRFLRIAALVHGQVTNLSNISRDAAVSRSTVSAYFSILEDTLLGSFLPAWRPRLKVKEMQHPKFYFFDNGVYRALSDRLGDRPSPEERGLLFETAVYNELKAALEYQRKRGTLFFWRTHDGVEVDFVWQRGDQVVAIEAKSTDTWKPEFSKGLFSIQSVSRQPVTCLGVYAGTRRLKLPFGTVYPFEEFSRVLLSGEWLKKSG